MKEATPSPGAGYPLWKKIGVSLFILFHWGCVAAWLMPKPSPIKSYLLTRRLPLPGYAVEGGERTNWRVASRPVVATYLFQTAQWQDWSMFAPNPLQVNRYASAVLYRRDGSIQPVPLPRLSQMSVWEAWVQKRWRKYQQNFFESHPVYMEEFARYLARTHQDAANPVTRVVILGHESAIPRHDRPELVSGAESWVDYTDRLRTRAVYTVRVLRDVPIAGVP